MTIYGTYAGNISMQDAGPLPLLAAIELTKTYRGTAAVSEVSFSIAGGQILGYLGPNGSGKSTTVKMLAGLMQPTKGRILYRGQSISEDPLRYKSQLGYVPEEANLYGFLTAWEYLELIASLRRMESHRFETRCASLLEAFGLYSNRHVRLSSYSKGMRQRVLLIGALLHDPEVLILDEPFSGLDVTTSLIVRELLKLLAKSGKAIFFASPVVEMFEKICTHVLLLRKGCPVAYGPVNEITESAVAVNLEGAFLNLAEDLNASHVAENIVAVVTAPQ
jgi:ABC-2 type transport system ATP-binding protein